MNSVVPDLAIVPRLCSRSRLVIPWRKEPLQLVTQRTAYSSLPIPVSVMCRTLLSLSPYTTHSTHYKCPQLALAFDIYFFSFNHMVQSTPCHAFPCTKILTLILIESSSVALRADLSVRDRKRILSRASEAFEINSLRNIYKENTK